MVLSLKIQDLEDKKFFEVISKIYNFSIKFEKDIVKIFFKKKDFLIIEIVKELFLEESGLLKNFKDRKYLLPLKNNFEFNFLFVYYSIFITHNIFFLLNLKKKCLQYTK